jgi:TPR repeat protein
MVSLIALGVLLVIFHGWAGNELVLLGEKMKGGQRVGAPPLEPTKANPIGNTDASATQSNEKQPANVSDSTTGAGNAALPTVPNPAPSLPLPAASSSEPSGQRSAAANSVVNPPELTPEGASPQEERLLPPKDQKAAHLLWDEVAKGNLTAEVELADMYATGEGVAQSCAQARVLLQAAIKKGSGIATEKLRQLDSQGCP